MNHNEITNAKKWTILVITSLSTFMATLDGSNCQHITANDVQRALKLR